jgi:modulator of FtsH protease
MFNPGNNNPYGGGFGGGGFGGRRGAFASRYQYQPVAPGANAETASSLISKVMGMLAFAFVFAFLGAFVGVVIGLTFNAYIFVVIAGFVVLLILNFTMNRSPGLSLFLLYLFTFLEGLGLAPLIGIYLNTPGYSQILGEAFLITAITSFGLAAYAWTTKRDFSGIGSKLFVGLIILLVASLVSFFFHSTFFIFLICVAGVGLFSMYLIFYVQRAKFMADTLPNAIGLTVSIFITVLNLFIYILYILTILQGGNRGGGRR